MMMMARPPANAMLQCCAVLSALLLSGAFAAASVSVVSSPAPYEHLRGKPYTVDWDYRAIRLNGERVLLLSGGMHYSRATPAMWPGLMRELRNAGLNTLQSYVFWNYHEVERGVWDFTTEARNLTAFLQTAADAGLFVNLRMGPFVCGEWTYGGIPVWLRSSWAFRDANPGWLAAMSDFYAVLIPLIEPFFARNGGPIILTQIENEYTTAAHTRRRTGIRGSTYPVTPGHCSLTLSFRRSLVWQIWHHREQPSDRQSTAIRRLVRRIQRSTGD